MCSGGSAHHQSPRSVYFIYTHHSQTWDQKGSKNEGWDFIYLGISGSFCLGCWDTKGGQGMIVYQPMFHWGQGDFCPENRGTVPEWRAVESTQVTLDPPAKRPPLSTAFQAHLLEAVGSPPVASWGGQGCHTGGSPMVPTDSPALCRGPKPWTRCCLDSEPTALMLPVTSKNLPLKGFSIYNIHAFPPHMTSIRYFDRK